MIYKQNLLFILIPCILTACSLISATGCEDLLYSDTCVMEIGECPSSDIQYTYQRCNNSQGTPYFIHFIQKYPYNEKNLKEVMKKIEAEACTSQDIIYNK